MIPQINDSHSRTFDLLPNQWAYFTFELCHVVHMRKQRRRSASRFYQRLCFRYTDSTIPLLPKSEISNLEPSSIIVQPGLCWTWLKTLKTGFLTTRLILYLSRFEHCCSEGSEGFTKKFFLALLSLYLDIANTKVIIPASLLSPVPEEGMDREV